MSSHYFLAALAATALLGCTGTYQGISATAELKPTAGNHTFGKVLLSQHQGGIVKVAGQIRGLTPSSNHGFHIHEKGDCSSPDASSAGAHFNPSGSLHGMRGQPASHAGDLPNLQANPNGLAIVQFETKQLQLGEYPNSVMNKALIVHANADDYQSQPAGNAGTRIACGVIELQ